MSESAQRAHGHGKSSVDGVRSRDSGKAGVERTDGRKGHAASVKYSPSCFSATTFGRSPATPTRPAWDMETLKLAIKRAKVGSGEVKDVILSCTFRPREQAFTSLITVCGRRGEWQKSLEVFDSMKCLPGVRPNFYTYSALITACSNAGEWRECLQIFAKMREAAMRDPMCRPNSVTYSAIVMACERAGYFEQALVHFDDLMRLGMEPDRGMFESVLLACEKLEDWEKAESVLARMHDLGVSGPPTVYVDLLGHYARTGMWQAANELFLTMQMLDREPDAHCCRALMFALEAGSQAEMARGLLREMHAADIGIDMETYNSALRAFAKVGHCGTACETLEEIERMQLAISGDTATAVLWSCFVGGREDVSARLAQKFLDMGLSVDVGRIRDAALRARVNGHGGDS